MKRNLLFCLITLVTLSISFLVEFKDEKLSLPDSLLKCLHHPASASDQSLSRVFFSPVPSNTFLECLVQLSNLKKETIDDIKDDQLSLLHTTMNSKQVKQDPAIKSTSWKGKGYSMVELFSIWDEIKYLYPVCNRNDFTLKPVSFASGASCKCYLGETRLLTNQEATMTLPARIVYKHLNGISYVPLVNSVNAIKLTELRLCLFNDFHLCPNLHPLLGVVLTNNPTNKKERHFTGFVSEFATHGTLFDYIRRNKNSIQIDKLLEGMLELAEGIQFLHERGLVHRDIKNDNILVFEENPNKFVFKLSDFGLCSPTDKCYPLMMPADPEKKISLLRMYPMEVFVDGKKCLVSSTDDLNIPLDDYLSIQIDWNMFGKTISHTLSMLDMKWKEKLVHLNQLVGILTGLQYMFNKDNLSLIKNHFLIEIESIKKGNTLSNSLQSFKPPSPISSTPSSSSYSFSMPPSCFPVGSSTTNSSTLMEGVICESNDSQYSDLATSNDQDESFGSDGEYSVISSPIPSANIPKSKNQNETKSLTKSKEIQISPIDNLAIINSNNLETEFSFDQSFFLKDLNISKISVTNNTFSNYDANVSSSKEKKESKLNEIEHDQLENLVIDILGDY